MSSIVLPMDRYQEHQNSNSVLVLDPVTRMVLDGITKPEMLGVRREQRVPDYRTGSLNSYSFYTHTNGLKLGAAKTLTELFADIDRYMCDVGAEAALAAYTLYVDDAHLADTQRWVTRTYTLSEVADATIPNFPDEDFED